MQTALGGGRPGSFPTGRVAPQCFALFQAWKQIVKDSTCLLSGAPAVRTPRVWRSLWRSLELAADEARFDVRGFPAGDPGKRAHLQQIGRTFIEGYNASLAADGKSHLGLLIQSVPPELRGFAAEGMAMGAAVRCALSLSPRRFREAMGQLGPEFGYLGHVGAGWAIARVPWARWLLWESLDSIHRWLAFDGVGFHDAFFYHPRILRGWRRWRSGYAASAYDQGVGRALWFVGGGSVAVAANATRAFQADRQDALWAGLGLAVAYAGPVDSHDIARELREAGVHRKHFAQGVAFACEARTKEGYVPTYTELCARTVWGMPADRVAAEVQAARVRLPATDADLPRYEAWRRAIAASFVAAGGEGQ